MHNLLAWASANKALLLSTACLLISETLPFIKSTKWNGLLQGLLSLLQKEQPPVTLVK